MNQAHDVYEGVHHQQRNACNMRLAMLTQSSYCLQEQAGIFAYVRQKKAGSLMLIGIKAFRTNRHQQMAKRQAAGQADGLRRHLLLKTALAAWRSPLQVGPVKLQMWCELFVASDLLQQCACLMIAVSTWYHLIDLLTCCSLCDTEGLSDHQIGMSQRIMSSRICCQACPQRACCLHACIGDGHLQALQLGINTCQRL